MKREIQIAIRVTDLEKQGFERAAELAGIGLSAWARERLRGAAIRELQEAGEKIVFVKPASIRKENEKGN
jgi:hypothetical protein